MLRTKFALEMHHTYREANEKASFTCWHTEESFWDKVVELKESIRTSAEAGEGSLFVEPSKDELAATDAAVNHFKGYHGMYVKVDYKTAGMKAYTVSWCDSPYDTLDDISNRLDDF